jgi:FkbM family methyltransferase
MNKAIVNDLSPFGRHAPVGLAGAILEMTRACPASWAGARRAFFLRSLAVQLLSGRPLDVEALGARMRLYPSNNTCEKRLLFTPHYFDPAERALLMNVASEDLHFVDIGASAGPYALFMAGLSGARAQILAIEPNPVIFERLVYNIRQNPFATVKALDCAVADREGEITLFLDAQNQGRTSVRISDAQGGSLKVHARTLKAILLSEAYERIDALKIDVSGAEDVILEPFFREAAPQLWPRLILCARANAGWSVDLERMMPAYGYREVLRSRENIGWQRA